MKARGLRRSAGRMVWLGAAAVVTVPATAQQPEDGGTVLETLEVTAPRLARDWLDTPAAVGIVERQDLRQARQLLQLDESLNRIPGLFMQNRYNFAQDIRLSIRGFGARAPFGIRGVRLIVDGVPETTPDGQSQVDSIDLLSVQRVEVIRGPHSALYGNATGGVVYITTEDGPAEPFVSGQAVGGSYGFQRAAVQTGGEAGPWNYHVSGWHMDYDGYREQSRARKSFVRANVRYELAGGATLTGLFNYLDAPTTQDAGGLTLAEAQADRRGAHPMSLLLDAGQSAEQWRTGLVYRDQWASGDEIVARAFYTSRDFLQQLPFPGSSLVGYSRDFYGTGLQFTGERVIGGYDNRFTVGIDAEQQRDARERFISTAAGVGPLALDQTEKAGYIGLYAQNDIALTERLTGTAGLRFDRLRFSIDDRFQAGGEDLSGNRRFNEWSYSLGLNHALRDQHHVYVGMGTAFETPTFTEFANPAGTGGFNPEVEPQQAWSVETGVKGLGGRFQYQASVHLARVRDELVPYQLDDPLDNRTYYRNAGRTERYGLELGGTWFFTDAISASASYTWSEFEYRRFEDAAGNQFDGNRLPGIPRHTVFGELAVRNPSGAYTVLDMLFVDNLYADDANTVQTPSYVVFNLRAGMDASFNGWRVEPYVAVNNVLDREYFANVRLNAGAGRFYEPAPERNYFAGISVRR